MHMRAVWDRTKEHPGPLGAAVILDSDVRQAVARDYGGYVHNLPSGVIRPASVDEVVAGVHYAKAQGAKLAVRGAGHSTHGQAQVADGVVLDFTALNRILDITPDHMWVEAGVLWRDVARAAFDIGRTFPVFTDYLATTVGGTLCVGGVGSRTWQLGTQTDHVLELEVVTADGAVHRCAPDHNAALFDAVRGGLGQFGIITKACLRLVEAPALVHYHRALYADHAAFLHELNLLIDEAQYECIQGFALANDKEAIGAHLGPAAAASLALPIGSEPWLYCIETVRFLASSADPATTMLPRQTWIPGAHFVAELPYLAYIDRLGPAEEMMRQVGLWQLPHPMLDLLLPGASVSLFLDVLLATVAPAEVAGPVLIYPYWRDALRTPFFRAPEASRITLVGLMRTTLPPTPDHVEQQVADNLRLHRRAVELGGCTYPVDSIPMTAQEWQQHYGEQWQDFAHAKRRYDPDHLLNPGQGIF
jgi:cytokinin dehydrogenase